MNTERPTPRTDAETYSRLVDDPERPLEYEHYVDADFARTLERELAEARERIAELSSPAAAPIFLGPATEQEAGAERGGGEPTHICPECDGQGFTVTPDREGEPEMSQCRTCWERENPSQLEPPTGWRREFIEGNGVDRELWVSPDGKCYDELPPQQPEPQSAEEWVRVKMQDTYFANGKVEFLHLSHALDLARRCDLLTQNNEDAQKLVHEYHDANESLRAQLAAAQAEAREYKEALDWLEDECPQIAHDAWTCSVDMSGNRWTLRFRNDGKRESIRGRTLVEAVNKARAVLAKHAKEGGR